MGLRSVRKWDWKVIVLCVLSSTIFWILNALNKDNYTTKISYPLVFDISEPDSFIAVQKPPSDISVNVTGTGWNLLQKSLGINVKPMTVYLNDPTETKTISSRSLLSDVIDRLREVQVNFILEDTIRFDYDRKIIKVAKLIPDSIGINLDENHRIVGDIRISPDSVIFSGPMRFITNLKDTLHVFITEENLDEDYDERVKIVYQRHPKINASPDRVNVSFKVARFLPRQSPVYLRTIGFPKDSTVYPAQDIIFLDYLVQEETDESKGADSLFLDVYYEDVIKSDTVVTLRPENLMNVPDYYTEPVLSNDTIKVIYDTKNAKNRRYRRNR